MVLATTVDLVVAAPPTGGTASASAIERRLAPSPSAKPTARYPGPEIEIVRLAQEGKLMQVRKQLAHRTALQRSAQAADRRCRASDQSQQVSSPPARP